MRIVRNILVISGFLFIGIIIFRTIYLQKIADKSSFNGIVTSIIQHQKKSFYTIELSYKDFKCEVRIKNDEEGELNIKYGDSIFKKNQSENIFVKRYLNSSNIEALKDVYCTFIECK